ncbi:hypothetical protein TOC8172_32100 [Pseudomonas syringae]
MGVGIAPSKTLAKLANYTAKRIQAHTGEVVDICDPVKRDWVLRNTSVGEVWGIGRNMKAHLEGMRILSAKDLAKADPWMLRKTFSVVIEKTARELAGTACLELDEVEPPRQEICCSRMFGKRLTELGPIKEAVATYMMRASEKLRAQGSVCKKIRVSIRTGQFNPDEAKYANGALVQLPYPTNDVRLMAQYATEAVSRIFRPSFRYSKAEVLLMDICQPGEFTDDLFEAINIRTAIDLARADARTLRDRFSVVIEKTARELAGIPCLELGEAAPPKQDINCSRMFGRRLTELGPIKEAD